MKKFVRQVRTFLLLDALIILFCIPGIYQINQKADLPFKLIKEQDYFVIEKSVHSTFDLSGGDTLISIDGRKFSQREEIEVYLDSKSIGDNVSIAFMHDGKPRTSQVALVEYYSLGFVISNGLAGILFILFGIFVLIKCPELKAAKIFHWGSIGIAILLLYTWGRYTIFPSGLGVAVRILYQFAYLLTPAAFLHFSLTFPKDRETRFRYLINLLYTASIIIALINIYFFIRIFLSLTVEEIANYHLAFVLNRIFSMLMILASIFVFIISYRTSKNEVEKKKLKWLLTGFLIGPFSFAVLWALPLTLLSYALIPEILLPFLMMSIPVTFTIAIVRYHLMDIDLLIRRSIVYFIVIFLLILFYVAVISVITNHVQIINNQIPSIVAAIIVALLFEPVRRKVQHYVDKKFFRVQYNFREALRKFIKNISEVNTIQQLAEMIVMEIQEFIPVEKLGFFLLKKGYIRLIAHQNFDLLVKRSLKFDSVNLKSDLSNPVAHPSKVEAGVPFEAADINTFKRWGMDLVIPVKSADGEIYAFLVLGGKKSGGLFTIEDVDLLNNVASNTASTIARIYLQEELIIKSMETERLEELNKQKTMFVSTVSHDLRTPLASIKVFSEMIRSDKNIPEKQKNYMEIIEGESDRLTRLINNVLVFARIENGSRRYSFETISLNDIVQKILNILSYQIKMEGFTVDEKLSPDHHMILADPEAVMQAIINLIANAMKFSIKEKYLSISTFRSENFACIEIRDRGIGIKPEDLKNLFKPFFRSGIAGSKRISGTGLGLSIIKHVMDAHNGKIEVESIPEEGTSFTLKFPFESYENTGHLSQHIISNSVKEQEG